MSSTSKLPLPAFLKLLTDANMTMPKTMFIASRIYKTHNTPTNLGQLTDSQLKALGVDAKEDRKLVLVAVRNAGYKMTAKADPTNGASSSSVGSLSQKQPSPKKRKRSTRDDDLLPSGPPDTAASFGSFEFNEVLDESVLKTKTAVVNRAPVMTAWATVVAERMGFKREEALSIASAYTEMNAISKGVSLGIFDQKKGKGVEIAKGESQPYVDFMGRRPVFTSQSSQWRALVKGEPIDPSTAFSYLSRSFRQTLPHVIGALRLLAESYAIPELNQKGFSLYADFRPEVDAWGKRAEVRCGTILDLRKKRTQAQGMIIENMTSKPSEPATDRIELQIKPDLEGGSDQTDFREEGPSPKKVKSMTLEEYEAALDESIYFEGVDDGL